MESQIIVFRSRNIRGSPVPGFTVSDTYSGGVNFPKIESEVPSKHDPRERLDFRHDANLGLTKR